MKFGETKGELRKLKKSKMGKDAPTAIVVAYAIVDD